MPDQLIPIAVPGTKGKVEVATNSGIFFKVLLNGTVLSRKKGVWNIPLRNGKSGELRARGVLPGFQSLVFNGNVVHKFGADVPAALRVLTLLPLLLVKLNPFVGMVLAVVLVFLNVLGVANANVPLKIRWVLPFTNTAAGALLVFLVNTLASAASTTVGA